MNAPVRAWTCEPCSGSYGAVIVDADENGIGEVNRDLAPLAAAAPALLAALRCLLGVVTTPDGSGACLGAAVAVARKAMAQAEGRAP